MYVQNTWTLCVLADNKTESNTWQTFDCDMNTQQFKKMITIIILILSQLSVCRVL